MQKYFFYLIVLVSLYCESLARTPPPPTPPPLECYKCKSDVLPDCANNPSVELPHSSCSHFRQQCVTVIVDGITFRGCTTEVQIPIDVEDFIYCNKTLCNREIYPPGRRKCYQCEGKNCLTNFETTLKPCVNYVEGDYCVTDVIDETDVIRGCLSDPDYSAAPYAQMCQINGCNNHSAITEVECISCTSKKDKNCIRNLIEAGKSCTVPITKTCKVNALLGRADETCFVYHKYGEVIRGCTRYGGKLQLEKFFMTCNGNRCNKECISDKKCIVCDSHKDSKCAKNAVQLRPQICQRQSFCFACERSDGVITRGCGNVDNHENCYKCQDSDGCNEKIILKCFNCTSEVDPNCAQLINLEKIKIEVCSNLDDKCIVAVRKDGHTIRGCSSAKQACGRNENCIDCRKNLCNGGIFPQKRQLCFHCADDLECRQNLSNKKPVPCKKYTRRSACFQYINKNHEMIRGCISDKEFASCKAEGDDMCLTCNQSGCNKRLAVRTSQISCINCEKTNKGCPWSQKPQTSTKCSQEIPYFLNETCFSRLEEDGTTTRGCSVGKEACTKRKEKCITCEFDGCNKEKLQAQSCIQCQSNVDGQSTCANFTEGKVCNADVQYFENRGCYVKREDDVIKRGCLVDLSEDDRQKCKKKELYCLYCEGQNCNIMAAPNLGAFLQSSIKLFIIYSAFVFITSI